VSSAGWVCAALSWLSSSMAQPESCLILEALSAVHAVTAAPLGMADVWEEAEDSPPGYQHAAQPVRAVLHPTVKFLQHALWIWAGRRQGSLDRHGLQLSSTIVLCSVVLCLHGAVDQPSARVLCAGQAPAVRAPRQRSVPQVLRSIPYVCHEGGSGLRQCKVHPMGKWLGPVTVWEVSLGAFGNVSSGSQAEVAHGMSGSVPGTVHYFYRPV
jgi:hypothetical protein